MRVVVVGATGNVGTALLRRLAAEPVVDAIAGVARRLPPNGAGPPYQSVTWHQIDIGAQHAVAALTEAFRGAGAVVHLAWQIQPSHDRRQLRRTNVTGTAQVVEAVVRTGVPALVVASSVGAYAPGPKDPPVTEDWPATGVRGSTYSSHKAAQEALLDEVDRQYPQLRLVRLRPGLIFQREAGSEIARYFIGPLAPLGLLAAGRLPVVPWHPRLRVQAVHADDVADAYARAVVSDVRGAFNLASAPVLDGRVLARRFGGVAVPTPPGLLLAGAAASWYARLQPTEPGWIRMAVAGPLLSTRRAEHELGWQARMDAVTALAELLDGMARRDGMPVAPLRPRPSATGRAVALLSGRLPGHGNPY